jgi:betaine-aldehyde dehydrogenase
LTVFADRFCMIGSLAVVLRQISDRFRDMLAERLTQVRVGPASDPRSEMGPLIDKRNVDRVNQRVEEAIAAGAKVIIRGGPVTESPGERGLL